MFEKLSEDKPKVIIEQISDREQFESDQINQEHRVMFM